MEPYRKHQEGQDCFLKYIAKRIKVLTKKLDGLTSSASPVPQDQTEKDKGMDLTSRRKQIEEEIYQFQSMREHYFNALARKDDKQERSADPQSIPQLGLSHTLAELVVFGGLSLKDTVVRQQLNTVGKEQQLSFRHTVKSLFEIDPKQQSLPVHEIISIKTAEFEKALNDKNTRQALNHLEQLKFKSYSDLRQEIVVEEAQPSESDDEGSSPSKKVLKDKKNTSSEEHPRQQQDYDGDEEIVTGESDCKNDSEGDVKKKRFHCKKKNATKAKKYVEEENYYASQQEQKHKKSHTAAVNWRIRGDHEYDTDKEKLPENKNKPAGG